MNHSQSNRRNRGRGNPRRGGGQGGRGGQGGQGGRGSGPGNRAEPKVRGNAKQLLEKYNNLARDAMQTGDRVQAEHYFQFSDHYQRIVNEMSGSRSSSPAKDNSAGKESDVPADGDGHNKGQQATGQQPGGENSGRKRRRGRGSRKPEQSEQSEQSGQDVRAGADSDAKSGKSDAQEPAETPAGAKSETKSAETKKEPEKEAKKEPKAEASKTSEKPGPVKFGEETAA